VRVMARTRQPSGSTYTGGARAEVIELIREIQRLTLELRNLERRRATREAAATERVVEQLRWRLAVAARRSATGDLGAAA
jgi:hypothetical protein